MKIARLILKVHVRGNLRGIISTALLSNYVVEICREKGLKQMEGAVISLRSV